MRWATAVATSFFANARAVTTAVRSGVVVHGLGDCVGDDVGDCVVSGGAVGVAVCVIVGLVGDAGDCVIVGSGVGVGGCVVAGTCVGTRITADGRGSGITGDVGDVPSVGSGVGLENAAAPAALNNPARIAEAVCTGSDAMAPRTILDAIVSDGSPNTLSAWLP